MKKLKIYAFIAIAGLASSSCNKYLDINDNPNVAHIEDVSPALIFPGAVSQLNRIQVGEDSRYSSMMTFGSLVMNNWSHNPNTFGNPFSTEYSLNFNNSHYGGIWSGIYLYCANLKLIENYKNDDHSQDNYVAMAKIMKAFYMQYIVDLYGDAPYSEAFKRSDNTTPKYDDDKDIYKALISELETANSLIDNASSYPVAQNPGSADIVFGGAMNNWKAFSNTIKLRMLLRMSKVTGEMAAYRDAKLATLSNAVFIGQDVTQNPGFSTANNDKMNPFAFSYFATSTGTQVQNYKMLAPTEHIANILNGNLLGDANYAKYSGIADPRRSRLFTLKTINSIQQIVGVRQGGQAGQAGVPASPSQLAYGNFMGSGTTLASVNRGAMIMSLAESKFLQAEAATRYPGMFTSINANAAFQDGIKASCSWLGVTSAPTISSYINVISSKPGLGYTGTTDQKIEAIITQKYIALVNLNPTESFIEYNRTGYPYDPMAITSTQPNKPYRLVYPVSEYIANTSNVPNITTADIFVKNQFTPFWNAN